MLKNYILIAFRNIKKHKSFTLINIAGLSLSMAVCLVIILLVYDHFQFDKFHPETSKTYRLLTYNKKATGFFDGYASSPLPVKEALEGKFASIETIAQLNGSLRGEIRSPHKILSIGNLNRRQGLYADEKFFEVFGFDLIHGTLSNALTEPFSIILSSEMADLLFPDEDPLGKLVEFEDHGNYKVTGILATPPGKSHIQFDVLASISSLPVLEKKEIISDRYNVWRNAYSGYNYLILNDPESIPEIEKYLQSRSEKELISEENPDAGFAFHLQPLSEITPGMIYSNELSFALPWFVLLFFGILGLIVMVTATINYSNLSIAKALSRTKEIGIRKANGASKKQILFQFLVESTLMAFLALIFAILIYYQLVEKFNSLWIFSIVGLELSQHPAVWIWFLIFTLSIGLVTGLAPAWFMAKMDPVRTLKGDSAVQKNSRGFMSIFSRKRLMLAIQFGLSFIMLISIFLLRDQANYLIKSDYGFDEESVFFVNLQGHDPAKIQSEFESVPGVVLSGFTSHHPGVGRSHADKAYRRQDDEPISLYYFSVDKNYLHIMDLELIAGNNLPSSTSEHEKFVLINELAAERLGFESPSDAIGEFIMYPEKSVQITGVVKNYHWEPLMKSIRPLALRILPENFEFAYFKTTGNPVQLKSAFEEKWSAYDPSRDFQGGLLNEEMDKFYQFLKDLGDILVFIAVLAIGITSLGFLGMVSYELKSRVKEIGIRKVLGATFGNLLLHLSKKFLSLILFTATVFIPAAILINRLWLYEMAFHVPISIWNVGPAIMIVLLLSAFTIFSQVWNSSRANPVESLRNE